MKHSNVPFLALIICLQFTSRAIASEVPDAIRPTERIELFNGKDFSGWTFFLRSNATPADTFAVTNGAMHCKGQPFGYVRTEKSFKDYRLTIEWRFVKVAPRADNSGVIVHVQMPDAIWPKAAENQGQFHHQGDIILMGGVTCQGHETAQSRSIKMQQPQNEKEVGEWNTYEVVCDGNSMTNFVNGKLMNSITGLSVNSGAIAIQSEGGEWELRKAIIEPLQP